MTPAHYPWHPAPGHTITGHVRVFPEVHSPQLHNTRAIQVYLPPSYYRSPKAYPVLYFQDGQNIFNRATSFLGVAWEVDESLEKLGPRGYEAIAVGIHNTGQARMAEYNPFNGGRGAAYLDFVMHTVKPLIDSTFRTLPDREHTGMVGSSLGALISLFAFFHAPHVFGQVGALSPALWPGRGAIYDYVRYAPFYPGKIYLDHGTREFSAQPMRDLLRQKGYADQGRARRLKYVVKRGARHTEAAWAKRVPGLVRFLVKRQRTKT